jgi:hypothetical protein
MATKPSSLPQWATDGGTTVEPSSGQKQTGWAVGTRPPARWMNWWKNLVYQWMQYLDAPAGTPGTVGNGGTALSATGGSTVSGSTGGGGLIGTGGAASAGTGSGGDGLTGTGGASAGGTGGAGVRGTGGSGNGSGGVFTAAGAGDGVQANGASGGGKGIVATGGDGATGALCIGGSGNADGMQGRGSGTGSGVVGKGAGTPVSASPTTGTGVVGLGAQTNGFGGEFFGKGSGAGAVGTGGATSGAIGLRGVGGSSNGVGIKAEGVGTGHALHAVGVDGYGVVAESDATSPAKAALRVVPQDTAPSSSPAAGDVFNTNGKFKAYTGVQWDRVLQQSKLSTADSDSAATTSETAFGETYSIPANLLQVGSTIRITAFGRCVTAAGGGSVVLRLKLDGSTLVLSHTITASTSNRFILEAVIAVRSIGASAALRACATAKHGLGSTNGQDVSYDVVTLTKDTTGALAVSITYDLSDATDVMRLDELIVDVN